MKHAFSIIVIIAISLAVRHAGERDQRARLAAEIRTMCAATAACVPDDPDTAGCIEAVTTAVAPKLDAASARTIGMTADLLSQINAECEHASCDARASCYSRGARTR